MQTAKSWIWTRVSVSLSYNDNHYTSSASEDRYYIMYKTIVDYEIVNL